MNTPAARLAAPAPLETDDEVVDDQPGDEDMKLIFEEWSYWCRTRRYFGPAPVGGNLLGKLSGKSCPMRHVGGPDAPCNARLAALHLAIIGQPKEALDTRVFWLYYGERTAYIKTAAEALGISRNHFYRLLRSFSLRVIAAANQIEAENSAVLATLPHRVPIREVDAAPASVHKLTE